MGAANHALSQTRRRSPALLRHTYYSRGAARGLQAWPGYLCVANFNLCLKIKGSARLAPEAILF
jgi:hypothetical protein